MSKTLQELESESAEFRAAELNADTEVARLVEHRKALLLTSSVDDIIEIDDEIRREKIAGEISQAKADDLAGDLYWARENARKYTGVAMPTDAQLTKLLAIVTEAVDFPGLEGEPSPEVLDEFKRAFFAVGRLGRLAEPDAGRYFSSSVDDANLVILKSHRLSEIEGDVLLAAALAWGDVAWRKSDKSIGQLQEIALARPNQGSPAKPIWRDILTGKASVLPPMSPRGMRNPSSSYPEPRIRIRYPETGREVDPAAPFQVQ
jgi:hypothetical protein